MHTKDGQNCHMLSRTLVTGIGVNEYYKIILQTGVKDQLQDWKIDKRCIFSEINGSFALYVNTASKNSLLKFSIYCNDYYAHLH